MPRLFATRAARSSGLARGSDAQARSQAFTVRAGVALALGLREEAQELAAALVQLGTALVPALNSPFPTLVEVAWVFRDLGGSDELGAVLDATPIESPWIDAARAIGAGELVRAADIVEGIGHGASAAYARLRAGEALVAVGRDAEAAAQRERAEEFYAIAGGSV